MLVCLGLQAVAAADLVDVFGEEVERFTGLLRSTSPERRLEGVQGLSHLKHWPAEAALIVLLDDPSPLVRGEVVTALSRLASAQSVSPLIGALEGGSWEVRQSAWLGLCRLTGLGFPADQPQRWRQWWRETGASRHEEVLLDATTNTSPSIRREDAFRALPHFATPASEAALIALLRQPGLTVEERDFVAAALERAGSTQAVPALASLPTDAAAWALGRIGGAGAEAALLRFRPTLPVLINLDRLQSTHAGPLIPYLVAQMGLVTYRGQPDDLMNTDPQPVQRVGANLILRSGRAPELVDQILLELEYSMAQPPAEPRPAIPLEWKPMLEQMRSELRPGFVREDGVTTSQPLTALSFIARDRGLVPRLLPLLRHPAFVARIYVGLTLARLQAREALPALLEQIREGYPFSDATALASGKHFDQSQTVRWRGFLCMAVGRLGGEEARLALEALAADPGQPRDIRYGSVVGLGFIGSAGSRSALEEVAAHDIIWMVREEARRVAAEIELAGREVLP